MFNPCQDSGCVPTSLIRENQFSRRLPLKPKYINFYYGFPEFSHAGRNSINPNAGWFVIKWSRNFMYYLCYNYLIYGLL
jgi:hypothetical protein